MKKRVWVRYSVLLLLIMSFVLLAACGEKKAPGAADGIDHTGFYVDGTTLRDAEGNPFVMRGINMAHCWFKDKDTVTLDAINKTKANYTEYDKAVAAAKEAMEDSGLDMTKEDPYRVGCAIGSGVGLVPLYS